MTRWRALWSTRWLCLLGSVVLLASVTAVARFRPRAIFPLGAERTRLVQERARLVGCNDQALATLRIQVAQLRDRKVQPEISPAWRMEPQPSDQGTALNRYLRQDSSCGWTDVVDLVSRLEAQGRVVSLRVNSSGSRVRRAISRVRIDVRSGSAP